MRIDRALVSALGAWGVALTCLTGCPGTLDDKQLFLSAAGVGGGAGGGGAGTGNEAGNAGTAAVAGAAGAGLGACGDVVARIFVPSCGGTGCHGSVAAQQGLDLVSPDVASRIVGVTGTVCATTLADPANPTASLMYQKLAAKPACGAQMPLARPPLSGADAACVLAWIAAQ